MLPEEIKWASPSEHTCPVSSGIEPHQCPHLADFLADEKQRNSLAIARRFVRLASMKSLELTQGVIPSLRCSVANDPSKRLHLCLSCVFIGCWNEGHIKNHFLQSGHCLALEVRRRQIYCFSCGDYVYNPDPMQQPRDPTTPQQPFAHRRKRPVGYVEWKPSADEQALVKRVSKAIDAPSQYLGLRGLTNLGSTCFMSSVVQALLHNPLLRAFFLGDRHNAHHCNFSSPPPVLPLSSPIPAPSYDGTPSTSAPAVIPTKNRVCIACEIDKLFSQAYCGKTEAYSAASLLYGVWTCAHHLAGYDQQDAHEFFITLLSLLHSHSSTRGEGRSPLRRACSCVVHRVFGGTLRSDVTCSSCHAVSTTFDPFFDISLDLPSNPETSPSGSEAATRQRHNMDGQQDNSLYSCLTRFTRAERLSVGEKLLCNRCGTYQDCTKQLSFAQLPPVLVFHLKRFEHATPGTMTKIGSFVWFPLDQLDLTPYTTTHLLKRSRRGEEDEVVAETLVAGEGVYDLFAVIVHHGTLDNGHYTAYVRKRSRWFLMDDAMVTAVDANQVAASSVYLLFYCFRTLTYAAKDDTGGPPPPTS